MPGGSKPVLQLSTRKLGRVIAGLVTANGRCNKQATLLVRVLNVSSLFLPYYITEMQERSATLTLDVWDEPCLVTDSNLLMSHGFGSQPKDEMSQKHRTCDRQASEDVPLLMGLKRGLPAVAKRASLSAETDLWPRKWALKEMVLGLLEDNAQQWRVR